MRTLRRAVGALPRALDGSSRRIVLAGLIGALLGALWGLADRPGYRAQATVVINDRGELTDEVGGGVAPEPDSASAARLADLARSEQVATEAAALLGGDVSGADLLAETTFGAGEQGGTVVVTSEAESADLAAAAANAFATALAEFAAERERRRLRSAGESIGEELQALDPLSEEAAALGGQLGLITALLALGQPVTVAGEAEIPQSPVSGRTPLRAAALGGAAGALAAVAVLWALELARRRDRVGEMRSALGDLPLVQLGPLGRAEGGLTVPEPAVVSVGPELYQPAGELIGMLAPKGEAERPRVIALTASGERDSAVPFGLALAASLAGVGAKVMLVEADLRRPSLASLLGVSPEPGLADYLARRSSPQEVMRGVQLAGGGLSASAREGALVAVPGGLAAASPGTLIGGSRFGRLTDRLRRTYDFVLYVTPPLAAASDVLSVAAVADAVLLGARLRATDPVELGRARARLEGTNLIGCAAIDD